MSDMDEQPIRPVPVLSPFESTLLHDNKRLRGELVQIADVLLPEWKEIGHPLRAEWMIEEIKKLEKYVEALIVVAARK